MAIEEECHYYASHTGRCHIISLHVLAYIIDDTGYIGVHHATHVVHCLKTSLKTLDV